MRHSGQTDPRGLGFSYEKASNAPSAPSSKTIPQQHKGTAVAFTYNPPTTPSKVEPASERNRSDIYAGSRIPEPRYGTSKLPVQSPRGSQMSEDKNVQTRPKSPSTRGEAMQSNIDESSELSSTSQESMVNEYAKESMRQKTSALIAGSTATAPILKSNIYKSPTTQSPASQISTRPKTTNDNDSYPRYSSTPTQPPPKQQRPSLWGQESKSSQLPSSTRLPVLTPKESAGIERKYTQGSSKQVKNSDGSFVESPDNLTAKQRTIGLRPSSSLVKINFIYSLSDTRI